MDYALDYNPLSRPERTVLATDLLDSLPAKGRRTLFEGRHEVDRHGNAIRLGLGATVRRR